METLTGKILLLPLVLVFVFFVTLPLFYILLGSELEYLEKDYKSNIKIGIGILLVIIAIYLHLQ